MQVKVIGKSSDGQRFETIVNVEFFTEESVKLAFEEKLKNIDGEDWSDFGYKIESVNKVEC